MDVEKTASRNSCVNHSPSMPQGNFAEICREGLGIPWGVNLGTESELSPATRGMSIPRGQASGSPVLMALSTCLPGGLHTMGTA